MVKQAPVVVSPLVKPSVLTLTEALLAFVAVEPREANPLKEMPANATWHPYLTTNLRFVCVLWIKLGGVQLRPRLAPNRLSRLAHDLDSLARCFSTIAAQTAFKSEAIGEICSTAKNRHLVLPSIGDDHA